MPPEGEIHDGPRQFSRKDLEDLRSCRRGLETCCSCEKSQLGQMHGRLNALVGCGQFRLTCPTWLSVGATVKFSVWAWSALPYGAYQAQRPPKVIPSIYDITEWIYLLIAD